MDKHEHKRLSIEFPVEQFVYLKMTCAKKGISLKDFVTEAVIHSMEEYEDELALKALNESLTEENLKNAVPWEKVKKDLGWDKL